MGDPTACGTCGRVNRDDARFCAGCGNALRAECPSCGRALAPDANFCDRCGHPVGSPGGSPAGPARDGARAADASAVRKTVTVLFGDLTGSTAFGERVDPELARRAMARYHEMARSTVRAHGGTVAKFIGDGVMALFGIPEVGEDDAERAVAAGLDLQRNFEVIRRDLAGRFAADIRLRIGINTGEVVIADDDADVVGDALNTASRLEAECPPGRVLVGPETWRLTRSTVSFTRVGEIRIRGREAAVEAFLVADRATPGATVPAEPPSPFVGRTAELAALREAFDAVVDHRHTRVTTIVGAPGLGKTRLARELAHRVRTEAQIMYLQCEQSGTSTYAPVAELLTSVARIDEEHRPDEVLSRLRAIVGEAPDAARVTELLAGLVGVGPARSTEDSFYAVRRLAEIHAELRPLVLVVDDLHWAGSILFDLLDHLARWVAAPVLVVALARPELRDVRPALAETGRHVTLTMSLDGLDPGDTAELATRLLGSKPLPAALTARLPLTTGGNPLFVRELVRMLADDGVLAESDAGWELAVDVDAIDVPPTIQSLLATRIERLPAGDRRVAELASLIGLEFPLGALEAIADDWTRAELEQSLERLQRREQIQPSGTTWGDEPLYRFHHVLVRDAAYRRVLKQTRADLHPRVAEWLESRSDGRIGEDDVTIAHHYEQAHTYQREMGIDEASDAGRRAARLFRRAADGALASDDLVTAGQLAHRALACLDDGGRPATATTADDGIKLDESATQPTGITARRRVTAHTGTADPTDVTDLTDPTDLTDTDPADTDLADLTDVTDHTDLADTDLADLTDLTDLTDPTDLTDVTGLTELTELTELLILGSEALLAMGDVHAAEPLVDRLAALVGDDERIAAWTTCFRGQLVVLTDPTGLTAAAASVDHAADRLAALGDHAGVAKARFVRASVLGRLGAVAACEVELDRALTAARTAGDQRRMTAVLGAAPVAALWGPSPVPRAGGRCLDVMRLSRITSDSPSVEATAVRCQAVLEALRGNHDTARVLLDTARTIGHDVGLRHGLLETDLYAGIAELLAGRPTDAEPHLRRAHAGLGELRIGTDAGLAAAYLARALLLQGRFDEAEELALDSDALAGQHPQTAIAARSALAEIRAARGDHDEAVRLAEEAVGLAAPTDVLVDHGNALLTLARVRGAAGDDHGRAVAAASAAQLFESKGALAAMALAADVAGPLLPGARWPVGGDVRRGSSPVDAIGNRAVELLAPLVRAWIADDPSALRALLAPDAAVHDRRAAADAVEMLVTEDETLELQLLAAHADVLALAAVPAPANALVVARWDDGAAVFDHVAIHDLADLTVAADELDDLLRRVDPSPHLALSLAFLGAHRRADADELDRLAAPAFEVVDHRELGFGRVERAEWLEIHRRSAAGGSVGGVLLAPRLHRSTPAGWVARTVYLVNVEPDRINLSVPTVAVGLIDAEGRVCALGFHPDDGIDLAMAELDEHAQRLVHSAVLGAATTPSSRGSSASPTSAGSPDPADAPGSIDSDGSPDPADAPGSIDSDVLPDPADAPGSDRAPATPRGPARSGRPALSADSPAAAAVLDATNHVARAISSRDAEEFLACWSRRLRFVDHRTIGWDTGGYERMGERFRSLNPDDERPRDRVRAEIVAIHHLEPPVLCHTGSHTVTTATGAELQERHVIVSRIDPATGQIELLEEYPDDQVDTALDRCSELAQEERVGANDAVFVGGAAHRRARSADLDGWASIVAPAYELVVEHGDGARRTTVRDAFVRGSVALHEAGFGVDDRRIVEVRHDRLALLELRGAGPPAQPAIAGELRARHTTTADTTTGHTTTADTRTADDDPAIVDQLRARHTTTADTTTADYMTTGHTTTADDTTAHTTTAGDDPGDVPGDDVVIGYVVDELDDAGRLLRTTRFDPGSLAAARAHLERRAGSTGRARDQVDTAAPGRQVRSR